MICLSSGAPGDYHPRCVKALFGVTQAPPIALELAKLHTVGLAMVGRVSLSGIQRKVSLGLDRERMTLQVLAEGARFILKPQAGTYPALPENEHLSMKLAALLNLEVPPCGLLRLPDNSLAYIVARFDRPATGSKLRQEDFCQLAGLQPKEKYAGSAELCARLVRQYADEPGVDMLKLFRMMVFAWCSGNGDLHLKNLSLFADPGGRAKLTPCYDCLNTRLVIPDDALALTVGGRKDRLTHADWQRYGVYCGLPDKAVRRVLEWPLKKHDEACSLIDRSFLPAEMKSEYHSLFTTRCQALVT